MSLPTCSRRPPRCRSQCCTSPRRPGAGSPSRHYHLSTWILSSYWLSLPPVNMNTLILHTVHTKHEDGVSQTGRLRSMAGKWEGPRQLPTVCPGDQHLGGVQGHHPAIMVLAPRHQEHLPVFKSVESRVEIILKSRNRRSHPPELREHWQRTHSRGQNEPQSARADFQSFPTCHRFTLYTLYSLYNTVHTYHRWSPSSVHTVGRRGHIHQWRQICRPSWYHMRSCSVLYCIYTVSSLYIVLILPCNVVTIPDIVLTLSYIVV